MPADRPRFRRKRYFVRGDIQGRYLRMILISATLPALIVSACLYYLMGQLMAEELAFPDAIYQHVVPVWKQVGVIMLIALPIVFVIIFIWGLVLSHKFAGPVFRIEEDLAKVAEGNYSVRVKFRKKDRLDSLAKGINEVLDQLEKCKKHG